MSTVSMYLKLVNGVSLLFDFHMFFQYLKVAIYLALMTTANGEHHQQQQITDDELFIPKMMDDDKAHFVQAELSTSQEQGNDELLGKEGGIYDVDQEMASFWPRIRAKIDALDPKTLREASRHQELQLPLARIKKIMKLDDDVKRMCLKHTEDNKRKTLQKSDISQAVARNDMFDFLIDIVPREDQRWPSQTNSHQEHSEELQPVVADANSMASTNGNVQYVLQVGSSDGALATGSVVQATQIGQPIQLPIGTGNQPIQLIALNLPEGNIQQFQVQLPPST
ncbi:Nuclear transcription factor Y subunit C-9 isoform 1 [Dirofilaria immitis]|nr:Nuclear transcription factor Y subunit C-9 isoform 1 [Dirofilaria immitis]